MKIISVEALPVAIPLKKPFAIALGAMSHCPHAIVRITTDDGLVGYGEASSWHLVYGYDQRAMIAAIQSYLGPAIMGMDPFEIEEILRRMDRALPYNLMAKAGIEIACQDIRGKALGVTTSRVIGGIGRETVEVVQVIDLVPPGEAAQIAVAALREGYRCIKIKIGKNPAEDIERVKRVREAVGSEIRLRADANQGYDRLSAMHVCKQLEPLDLQWIEQPLPERDLSGLAELKRTFAIPIAVDESVHTIHDFHRIIDGRSAEVVNIKIPKCGGILPALKMAYVAEAMNVPVFLGGCLETGIGTAAAIHYSMCAGNLMAGVEIVGSAFYEDDIVVEKMMVHEGMISVPQGPGIGVTIDTEKLEYYARSI